MKIVVASCLLTIAVVWGQASVDESKETFFVYVDATHGSDSNPGTPSSPFRTLSKGVNTAIAKSKSGIGTRVTVLPGTYRESITAAASFSAPVTIEAATAGTVTVSGADVWTGWQAYGGNPAMFTHAWPYQWGLCAQLPGPTEQNIVRRREIIFVNGFKLTQVLSSNDMNVGTFFVDESHKTVYIWPPSGTNMGTATIEVSTRPTLFLLQALQNWVIRGITFQYGNGCRQIQPAFSVGQGASNILIDNDKFLWNNAAGLSTGVSHVTVRNSQANHNGESGMLAQTVKYGQWTSNEGSYNNWRGAQGAYYAWQAAGGKFMGMHDTTFNAFSARFNLGKGIHLDTDNVNATVDTLLSFGNLRSGVQIEDTQGPVTITNSHICNSNVQAGQRFDGGVNLVNASNVILTGNTLYNNGTAQIILDGARGGYSIKNWETGASLQVRNQNFSANTNTIEATGSQQVFQDGFLTTDWPLFATTLNSNYNTWWHASNSAAFTVPVPTGYTNLNLSGWRTVTGRDAHSTFANPAGDPSVGCQATPDIADYWFVVDSASKTVSRGGAVPYTVTAIPLGFTGTISLKADWSQVPGATASWTSRSINSSGSSILTVTTSSSTPAGTYPLTMIANSGNITRTVAVYIVVQ